MISFFFLSEKLNSHAESRLPSLTSLIYHWLIFSATQVVFLLHRILFPLLLDFSHWQLPGRSPLRSSDHLGKCCTSHWMSIHLLAAISISNNAESIFRFDFEPFGFVLVWQRSKESSKIDRKHGSLCQKIAVSCHRCCLLVHLLQLLYQNSSEGCA